MKCHIKEKLKTLVFKNNIIKLLPNTSLTSSTYHSNYAENYSSLVNVVTVATDYNDSCDRYVKSCHRFGVNPVILGLGDVWKGGDMAKGPEEGKG